MQECITMFFAKSKWLRKTQIQNLRKVVEERSQTLLDNDLVIVKVFLDENDKAITGKDYYCDRCGLIVSAKVENCPRCNSPEMVEGRPTLEWVLEKSR